MDKYAPYVWASYGVVFTCLSAMALMLVMRLVVAKKRLARMEAEDSGE